MLKALKFIGIVVLVLAGAAGVILAAAALFLRYSPAVGSLPGEAESRDYAGRSAQYHDGRFYNAPNSRPHTGAGGETGARKRPQMKLPAETPDVLSEASGDDLMFTWLGHSSFLLQAGGLNILVDPVLGERASPLSFAGPKRFSDIPLKAADMPAVDILLISHDHYDHLDRRAVLDLKDKVKLFIVPLGVDAILKGWGIEAERIRALAWWETAEAGGTAVTLTPSQHFSGRNPLQGRRTLWGGYYIRNEAYSIYYTGDGAYSDVFAQVREKLGAPQLMIAECGQYDRAWADMHMFPEETVLAGKDAGAEWVITVHWGAFCICNHPWDDSIRRVTAAAEKQGLSLATPRIGQTADYRDIASYDEAWWEAYH